MATESHLPNQITRFIQSTSSNLLSIFSPLPTSTTSTTLPPPPPPPLQPPISISAATFSSYSSSSCVPLLFSEASPLLPPILTLSTTTATSDHPNQNEPMSSNSGSGSEPGSGSGSGYDSGSGATLFPSTVKISGLNSNPKVGGPAFVGQVFSMCDLSGTGLMAVSTHIEIPFLSKRTPKWIKKMFAKVTKSENNGPVFRFFMDLGDAVSYVKRLNIPTGVVGACRLDLAYEHFKEKPHMFRFIPNEKQVKAANKLLQAIPQRDGKRKVDGVPVFTAENLDIAIATSDGIKWYTPYFFDKNMLDNILEESVDQHFQTLIQSRHIQRRRDVIDDNLAAEIVEENADSLWEPPEVQEVLDEMGNPGIPLSVISKVAEMQLFYAVDKVLLGNRWLRKATGIQPKFPYMVDSFEKRSATSFLKSAELSRTTATSDADCNSNRQESLPGSSQLRLEESSTHGSEDQLTNQNDLRFPFGDWFSNPWSKQQPKQDSHIRLEGFEGTGSEFFKQVPPSPLLPKITMVGISTGETGQMSRASLKKTMENLTRELEQTGQPNSDGSSNERNEDRDPLFVANVGDYYNMAKTGSARYVRAGNN